MSQSARSEPVEHAAVAKFVRHIMPLLGLMYLVAYIDRQNIGFAKLQMAGDLGLSESAYGLGASLFFLVTSCSKCQVTCSWNASALGAGSPGSWSPGAR